jgi:WD40 repeat protein
MIKTLELTGSEHRIFIETISFSPDGKTLVSFSDEGNYIVAGGRKKKIRIWAASNWELLKTVDIVPTNQSKGWATEHKNAIAWSPDGAIFAIGVPDGTIQIRKAEDGELIQTLSEHTMWVTGVAFSPDGHYLASISLDGTLQLWGIR